MREAQAAEAGLGLRGEQARGAGKRVELDAKLVRRSMTRPAAVALEWKHLLANEAADGLLEFELPGREGEVDHAGLRSGELVRATAADGIAQPRLERQVPGSAELQGGRDPRGSSA